STGRPHVHSCGILPEQASQNRSQEKIPRYRPLIVSEVVLAKKNRCASVHAPLTTYPSYPQPSITTNINIKKKKEQKHTSLFFSQCATLQDFQKASRPLQCCCDGLAHFSRIGRTTQIRRTRAFLEYLLDGGHQLTGCDRTCGLLF